MKKKLLSLLLATTMLLTMVSTVTFATVADGTANPYKYCISGAGFDFEGYSIDSAIRDADGEAVSQLNGEPVGVSGASKMSIVADPTDDSNTVMKWDNTNGDSDADIYMNLGTASKYEIKDRDNNAVILSTDVYVDDASILGTMQLTWFTAYSSSRAHHYLYMMKNDDDTVNLSFNSKTVSFPEKEWHNVKWVFTMADHTVTIYLDDKAVASGQIGDGEFVKFDYIRTQMGAKTKGVVYFDNWGIYEAAANACAFAVKGYEAGETGTGTEVTFAVTDNTNTGYTIMKSEDEGATWTEYEGTTYTLTLEPVQFKVVTNTGEESDVIELQGEKLPIEIAYNGQATDLTEYQDVKIDVTGTRDYDLTLEWSTNGDDWNELATATPEDTFVTYTLTIGDNYIRVYDPETESYKVIKIEGVNPFPGTTLSCTEDLSNKIAGDKVTINVSVMREDTTIYVSTTGRNYEEYITLDKNDTSFRYTLSAGNNFLKAGLDGDVLKIENISAVRNMPYSFVVTEPAIDFEGYQFNGSFQDANGNGLVQYGVSPTYSLGLSTMDVVKDPADENNTVWKFSKVKGTEEAHQGYMNFGGLGVTAATPAVVFSTDVYVEEASDLSGNISLLMWKNIHVKDDGTTSSVFKYVTIAAAKDGNNLSLSDGLGSFPEKEWHNVRYIFTPSDGKGYLYLDYKLVNEAVVSSLPFKSVDYIRTNFGATSAGTYYLDNYSLYESAVIPVQEGTGEIGADGKSVTLHTNSDIPTLVYKGMTPEEIAQKYVKIYNGSNTIAAEKVEFVDSKTVTVTTKKEIFTSVNVTCELYLDKLNSIKFGFTREAASYDVEAVSITEDASGNVTATATVQNLDPVETKEMIMLLTLTNDEGVVEQVLFQPVTLAPGSENVPVSIENVAASGYDVKVFFCNGWDSLSPVKAVVYEK